MINSPHWVLENTLGISFLYHPSASFLKMACKASPIAVEVGDLFLPPLSEQIQNKSSLNISSLHLVLKWQVQLQRTVLSSVITWCAEWWLQDSPTDFTPLAGNKNLPWNLAFSTPWLRTVAHNEHRALWSSSEINPPLCRAFPLTLLRYRVYMTHPRAIGTSHRQLGEQPSV